MRTQTQPPGLQLQDVNTAFLDTLVLDYLAAEDFVEDDEQESQQQLSQRLVALAARQQLQRGDVHAAMGVAAHYCPAVLEDQRLSFRLKRQQFIELLRQETAAGDSAALECARQELAPLALNSYPEAFLDFKKTLLMLVDTQQQQQQLGGQQQQQQQQQQNNQQEWSLEARQQLAETLFHTMVLQMGCRAPSLSLLLRYLLLLYGQHTSAAASSGSSRGIGRSWHQLQQQQAQQLAASRGGRVAQGLLLEGRDEGPLPPDVVSGQQPRASDVQALMSALTLARRECEDALKLTGGDVAAALGHQLGRLRLDVAAVDALVWEYATARGLLEPADGPEAVAAAIAAAAATNPNPRTVAAAEEQEEEQGMDIDDSDAAAAAAAVAAPQQQQPQSPAAAAAATGPMPPPANRSAQKRSKAAISGDTPGGGSGTGGGSSSHSPFRFQQQQQQGLGAAAAAAGEQGVGGSSSSSLMVQPPGSCLAQGSAGQPAAQPPGLNRSASQSPPYKAPRYRRKQTPSRFYNAAGTEGPTAAAAAGSGGDTGSQQEQEWAGGQLEQVVVVLGSAAAGPPAAAHAATPPAAAAGDKQASPTGGALKAAGLTRSSSGGGGGGGAAAAAAAAGGAHAEAAPDVSTQQQQQQVAQVRAATQQQRWQALQQQLKGRVLAGSSSSSSSSSSGGGGGMLLSQQMEAQEQLQQIQRLLVQQQQYEAVEEAVERLAPGLLQQEQPRLLFELRRCKFIALVESNQLSAALQLARTQLTPLADAHPDLLPRVKASMSLLLPGMSSLSTSSAAAAAGGSSSGSSSGSSEERVQRVWEGLSPLLQAKLGIEPPQLVSLLQVLLTAHKAWFVRQRCSDPFAATLAINKLLPTAATSAAGAEAAAAAARADESPNEVVSDAIYRVVLARANGTAAARADAGAAGAAARLAAGAAAAAGAAPAWEYYGGGVGGGGRVGGVLAEAIAAGVFGPGAGAGALLPGEQQQELEDAAAAEEEMMDDEDEDLEFDEAAVLQVMEVLELPRGTAFELLAEHGGDAQAVIMAVLGG